MQSFARFLLLSACCWSAALAATTKVICYFNTSALKRPESSRILLSQIEPSFSYCTHLVVGYATINTETYKAVPPSEDEHTTYTNIVALRRRFPSLKILLSIGGGAADTDSREKFFELLESDEHRTTFVSSAKSLLKQHGFDGIDIAWEFPKNKAKKDRGTFGSIWHGIKKAVGAAHSHTDEKADEHKSQFSALIRELRTSLRNENALLTLSVIPYINQSLYYDPTALNQQIDQLHVLAFDYRNPERDPKEADYPAPLYPAGQRDSDLSVDGNIRWFLENSFPASKLVLGIPTFARTWKLTEDSKVSGAPPIETDGPGDQDAIVQTPGLLAYQSVCTLLPNPSNKDKPTTLRRVNDPSNRLGSYGFRLPSGDVNGLWVGFEDPDVAAYKAAYAKTKSLAGIAFSDLTLDDYNGICTGEKFPIVRAGTLKLRSP
ncbi:chitinase-like protein Idgf4 [Schistocerca americana]|uniref:chitinase-like protein Idgf4 n=1 Tax=Schistocerca americana TaxID=7009 RepID=UPI001F4F45CF|nr:chitinase-like protein Idgf4 [Schistocerca americana]